MLEGHFDSFVLSPFNSANPLVREIGSLSGSIDHFLEKDSGCPCLDQGRPLGSGACWLTVVTQQDGEIWLSLMKGCM